MPRPRTQKDLIRLYWAIDTVVFDHQCRRDRVRVTWTDYLQDQAEDVTLGHFDPTERTVHVWRRLAHRDVPEVVVRHIVHHELLHHVLGLGHGREFRAAERKLPGYREATSWLLRTTAEGLRP